MADRRILLTGGSGRLGTVIRRLVECVAPSHAEMPLENILCCFRWVDRVDPEIVLHCGGYVDAANAEIERERAWQANVTGTVNLMRASRGARFVYISTDYVFDGSRGNYCEKDIPGPVNYYGLTKLCGERTVLEHGNTLVLRVPFRADPPWRYRRAFTDQWTSCRWASEVAPDVVRATLMKFCGILHIGGPRRSIWEMAKSVSPEVGRMTREESAVPLPEDTSLDSSLWHSLSAR